MKHMITWHERPMGSPKDYEDAHHRILNVFKNWKCPASMKIIEFVIRVGEWGGFMLVETDDAAAMHKFTTTFPSFTFHVDQVINVQDAVTAELEAMASRDAVPY